MDPIQLKQNKTGAPPVLVTRRKLLTGGAALAATAIIANPHAVFAAEATDYHVSIPFIVDLVTGKKINEDLSKRAIKALSEHDSGFGKQLVMLSDFVLKNNIKSIEDLKVHSEFQGELKATSMKIISAIYLGYVGEPKNHSAHDNVKFITYTQAQTYALTQKYTPIPSYSRLKTGYWEHLPE